MEHVDGHREWFVPRDAGGEQRDVGRDRIRRVVPNMGIGGEDLKWYVASAALPRDTKLLVRVVLSLPLDLGAHPRAIICERLEVHDSWVALTRAQSLRMQIGCMREISRRSQERGNKRAALAHEL